MTQYIPKSALVAEIEKLKFNLCPEFYEYNYDAAKVELLEKIENFLDTLKVKEVDIEKEVIDWWNAHYSSKAYTFEGYTGHYVENSTLIEIAKHFFELGMTVSKV